MRAGSSCRSRCPSHHRPGHPASRPSSSSGTARGPPPVGRPRLRRPRCDHGRLRQRPPPSPPRGRGQAGWRRAGEAA
eukprot:1017613-Alexandrium_andersonii.AAC.1